METEIIETELSSFEDVENFEEITSCVDFENLEQLETLTETDISQDVEITQHLAEINEGLHTICGLLLFFFVMLIFTLLYRFIKSFF